MTDRQEGVGGLNPEYYQRTQNTSLSSLGSLLLPAPSLTLSPSTGISSVDGDEVLLLLLTGLPHLVEAVDVFPHLGLPAL